MKAIILAMLISSTSYGSKNDYIDGCTFGLMSSFEVLNKLNKTSNKYSFKKARRSCIETMTTEIKKGKVKILPGDSFINRNSGCFVGYTGGMGIYYGKKKFNMLLSTMKGTVLKAAAQACVKATQFSPKQINSKDISSSKSI